MGDRQVHHMCVAGRIEGAFKEGNLWLIPIDARKSIDLCKNSNKKSND